MHRPLVSLRRAAIGVLVVDVVAIAIITGRLQSARNTADSSEEAFVGLAKDVTRASQAQATAERMVAIGRGYLLTVEPGLLVRSQAADAKLARTMQGFSSGAAAGDDRTQLEPVLSSAASYRRIFSAMLSGASPPRGPYEVAHAFRKQLIPARDDLMSELDELITGKLERLEALRSTAREQRTNAMTVVVVTGMAGVLASAVLLFVLIGGVRAVAEASESAQPPAYQGRPDGSRLAPVYQFPRGDRNPRPPI
jgi:hypothetical protein